MKDIDKISEYLSGYVPRAKVLEFLEKPSPLFNDECILDMLKYQSAEQVIEKIEEALGG